MTRESIEEAVLDGQDVEFEVSDREASPPCKTGMTDPVVSEGQEALWIEEDMSAMFRKTATTETETGKKKKFHLFFRGKKKKKTTKSVVLLPQEEFTDETAKQENDEACHQAHIEDTKEESEQAPLPENDEAREDVESSNNAGGKVLECPIDVVAEEPRPEEPVQHSEETQDNEEDIREENEEEILDTAEASEDKVLAGSQEGTQESSDDTQQSIHEVVGQEALWVEDLSKKNKFNRLFRGKAKAKKSKATVVLLPQENMDENTDVENEKESPEPTFVREETEEEVNSRPVQVADKKLEVTQEAFQAEVEEVKQTDETALEEQMENDEAEVASRMEDISGEANQRSRKEHNEVEVVSQREDISAGQLDQPSETEHAEEPSACPDHVEKPLEISDEIEQIEQLSVVENTSEDVEMLLENTPSDDVSSLGLKTDTYEYNQENGVEVAEKNSAYSHKKAVEIVGIGSMSMEVETIEEEPLLDHSEAVSKQSEATSMRSEFSSKHSDESSSKQSDEFSFKHSDEFSSMHSEVSSKYSGVSTKHSEVSSKLRGIPSKPGKRRKGFLGLFQAKAKHSVSHLEKANSGDTGSIQEQLSVLDTDSKQSETEGSSPSSKSIEAKPDPADRYSVTCFGGSNAHDETSVTKQGMDVSEMPSTSVESLADVENEEIEDDIDEDDRYRIGPPRRSVELDDEEDSFVTGQQRVAAPYHDGAKNEDQSMIKDDGVSYIPRKKTMHAYRDAADDQTPLGSHQTSSTNDANSIVGRETRDSISETTEDFGTTTQDEATFVDSTPDDATTRSPPQVMENLSSRPIQSGKRRNRLAGMFGGNRNKSQQKARKADNAQNAKKVPRKEAGISLPGSQSKEASEAPSVGRCSIVEDQPSVASSIKGDSSTVIEKAINKGSMMAQVSNLDTEATLRSRRLRSSTTGSGKDVIDIIRERTQGSNGKRLDPLDSTPVIRRSVSKDPVGKEATVSKKNKEYDAPKSKNTKRYMSQAPTPRARKKSEPTDSKQTAVKARTDSHDSHQRQITKRLYGTPKGDRLATSSKKVYIGDLLNGSVGVSTDSTVDSAVTPSEEIRVNVKPTGSVVARF